MGGRALPRAAKSAKKAAHGGDDVLIVRRFGALVSRTVGTPPLPGWERENFARWGRAAKRPAPAVPDTFPAALCSRVSPA